MVAVKTTFTVAASNASAADQAAADYVCTGTNDMDTIYQAISNLPTTAGSPGGVIKLTEGFYSRKYPLAVDLSYVTIEGAGDATVIGAASNAIGPAHIIVGSDGAFDGVTGLTGYATPGSAPSEVYLRNFLIQDYSSDGHAVAGSTGGIIVRGSVVHINEVNIKTVATDGIREEAFRYVNGTEYVLDVATDAGAWANTATETWTVTTAGGAAGFYIVQPPTGTDYDAEMIYVTGVTGSGPYTWTVQRGVGQTTCKAHAAGSKICDVGLTVNFNNVVEDCQISSALRAGLVPAYGLEDSEFDKCLIEGGTGYGADSYTEYGIWAGGANLRFIDCHPWYCAQYGLYGGFQGYGTAAATLVVIAGEYESNGVSGINVEYAAGVTITGGVSLYSNGTNDVSISNTNGFSVSDNEMYSGGPADQELTNHVLITDCNQGTIHDNVMTGIVSGDMILITGQNSGAKNEISVHDNVCSTSGGTYETAIGIVNATNVNVHDNVCEASIAESGGDSDYNAIHDNIMVSATSGFNTVTAVGSATVVKDNYGAAGGGGTPAAPVVATAATPTGTASTTLKMVGLGQQFTPQGTGHVMVTATGQCALSASGSNNDIVGRYGTGSVPTNGEAVTGTIWGASSTPTVKASASTTITTSFAFVDLLDLTPGTEYWFDLAQASSSGTETASYQNIKLVIVELPS